MRDPIALEGEALRPVAQVPRLLLVEGPADMLAARSVGLPAVAVPGTQAWRADWARPFACCEVNIVMDADRAGREATLRIACDLGRHAARVSIIDLDPRRDDGYDLSDWLRAGHKPSDLPPAHPFARERQMQAASPASGPRRIGPTRGVARTASANAIARPGATLGPSSEARRRFQCGAF